MVIIMTKDIHYIKRTKKGNIVSSLQMADPCPYFINKRICVNDCCDCELGKECIVKFHIIGKLLKILGRK